MKRISICGFIRMRCLRRRQVVGVAKIEIKFLLQLCRHSKDRFVRLAQDLLDRVELQSKTKDSTILAVSLNDRGEARGVAFRCGDAVLITRFLLDPDAIGLRPGLRAKFARVRRARDRSSVLFLPGR